MGDRQDADLQNVEVLGPAHRQIAAPLVKRHVREGRPDRVAQVEERLAAMQEMVAGRASSRVIIAFLSSPRPLHSGRDRTPNGLRSSEAGIMNMSYDRSTG
jgi:hypothetical protein